MVASENEEWQSHLRQLIFVRYQLQLRIDRLQEQKDVLQPEFVKQSVEDCKAQIEYLGAVIPQLELDPPPSVLALQIDMNTVRTLFGIVTSLVTFAVGTRFRNL